MAMGPWRRDLYRRLRGGPPRRGRAPERGRQRGGHPLALTLAVGILLAGGIITLLEVRLRPMVAAVAQNQVQNTVTALLEHTVVDDLARRGVSYADLVTIQRDEAGTITALTTDMAALNLLRGELSGEVLGALETVDVSQVSIPLGSLLDTELLWARGPAIRARAIWTGALTAEFDSDFTAAGVNQTRHRIWLELAVPVTVLLPGGGLEVPVHTRLCVAETVIVGQVPDTYLQLDGLSSP